MNLNRKRFFVGIVCSGIMFFMGVLYLTVPAYYGTEYMANIDTNDLFVSMVLIYAVLNFIKYFLLGKNPNNENIYISIASSLTGTLNVLLNEFLEKNIILGISLLIFVLLITGIKLFTVDYYHDRKDAYYYIEGLLLAIFFIVGIVTSLNLFSDSILQTIMLGFYFIIIAILDTVNTAIKTMLKAKRFLNKIKLN